MPTCMAHSPSLIARIDLFYSIQFGAAVALTLCPGAPQLEFYAGRPAAVAASPDLLPGATESVDALLARFGDVGFSPDELVDLLASHSLAFQEHTDEAIPFTPLDSTPNVMDAQFHVEVLLNGTEYAGNNGQQPGEAKTPLKGEFRIQSDEALARDPRTACRWQSFISACIVPLLNVRRF